MVSILPGERTPWNLIGQSIGRNLEQTLPAAATKMGDRQALQQSLAKIKEMASNGDSSNLDIALGVMQAGAGIPGSERYMAQVMPMILQQAEAARSQKMFGGGQKTGQGQDMDMSSPQSQTSSSQDQSEVGKFFPDTKGAQLPSGNMPKSPMEEKVKPLKSSDQIWKEAPGFAKRSTDLGNPMTVPEAYDILSKMNEQDRADNTTIENQQVKRAQRQRDYGAKGENALSNVLPDATDEQVAMARKWGEKFSDENVSEADIDKLVANKARDFKNQLSNIRNDLSAPRTHKNIWRTARNTYKSLEEAMSSARTKVKPLLDQGLYDTARNELSNLGYYPEERETIINPLRSDVVSQMKQIPKHTDTTETMFETVRNYSPRDRELLKESMKEVFNKNPGISPTLARKVYEDQGYDWRVFEDTWNELRQSDALTNLSQDQINQSDSILKSPPIGGIEMILHDIGIIGR